METVETNTSDYVCPSSLDAGSFFIHHHINECASSSNGGLLRILCWNIERGYKLELLIEELKQCNADILALQEVDVKTGRPECGPRGSPEGIGVDCCKVIASALGMSYVGVVEMHFDKGGTQCNVVLSKFPLLHWGAVEHSTQVKSYSDGFPRSGKRCAAWAIVEAPHGKVLVYSDHFEMHQGMETRLQQLDHLLSHAATIEDVVDKYIMGDFNTFDGKIVRVLGTFKRAFRTPLHFACFCRLTEVDLWYDVVFGQKHPKIREKFRDCLPSSTRFRPVFGRHDTTVGYGWVYRMKIDWILHEGISTVTKRIIGNQKLAISDHKYLCVEVSNQI